MRLGSRRRSGSRGNFQRLATLQAAMVSRVAAPRVVTLAAVAGLHAGALLWLLTETGHQRERREPQATPIQVLVLQTLERATAGKTERPARSPRTHAVSGAETRPSASAAITSPPSTSIDWAAEASSAAERLIEKNEKSQRQANALIHAPSPMFAVPPGRSGEFPWQNRVEAAGGGATVIHIGDRCGIVLFLIIPFGGGCALEKAPARGDLFDYMHDHD